MTRSSLARHRLAAAITRIAHPICWFGEVADTLVLLDHQINRFLSIVQVKLVVLGLLLLLRFLIVVLLSVTQLLSFAPLVHGDGRTKLHLRLRSCLVLRAVQNFLLQLQLLTHLSRFVSPGLLAPAVLEERHRLSLLILGRDWLVCEVIEEHERWIKLCFLVEALVEEAHLFVVLFLKLTLDALILHKLQLLLLLRRGRLELGLRQS